MARDINIFLFRHAVSEANLDKSVNARLPDNRVPLAAVGHTQARDAAIPLAEHLKIIGGKTRILCSPYVRTRETSAQIENVFTEKGIKFDKREEIALREISFGLFDGLSEEDIPKVYPREYEHYQKYLDFEGEFWAPMPMGESRAQVADRVKGVFGTILRDSSRERLDPIHNFIVVSHGVTIRAFLMQWLHLSPEWYGEQKNPANASIIKVSKSPIGDHYVHEEFYEGFPHIRVSEQDKREES
jgi:2,3-bisphosphoglycerate-dependent phosphoglycerate mutase